MGKEHTGIDEASQNSTRTPLADSERETTRERRPPTTGRLLNMLGKDNNKAECSGKKRLTTFA